MSVNPWPADWLTLREFAAPASNDPMMVREGRRGIYPYGRVLADAVVNRMALAMPPKVRPQMAKGFSLYLLKAVIDGRAGDLIELARSIVLR
jgi:pyruvate dehydrogenase (quinone)